MNLNEQLELNKVKLKDSDISNLSYYFTGCMLHPDVYFNKIGIFNNPNNKDLFKLLNEFDKEIKNYRGMYLISVNQYCITPLIKQVNVILSIFKQIKKEYNRIKSNKDLKEYYITIDNLESDVIMDKFLDELNTLSIMYDFEVDAERVKKSLK